MCAFTQLRPVGPPGPCVMFGSYGTTSQESSSAMIFWKKDWASFRYDSPLKVQPSSKALAFSGKFLKALTSASPKHIISMDHCGIFLASVSNCGSTNLNSLLNVQLPQVCFWGSDNCDMVQLVYLLSQILNQRHHRNLTAHLGSEWLCILLSQILNQRHHRNLTAHSGSEYICQAIAVCESATTQKSYSPLGVSKHLPEVGKGEKTSTSILEPHHQFRKPNFGLFDLNLNIGTLTMGSNVWP